MKSFSKKIFSLVIAVVLLLSMTVCGFTANAVTSNLIDSAKKGTFSIHKFEMPDITEATVRGIGEETDDIPASAKPYADVTFTITRVADLVTNGNINKTYYTRTGVKLPTVAEAKVMTAIQTYSEITDTNGLAKFENLPLGIYLVQETKAPSQTTAKVSDFVVSIPMTDSTGTAWNYNVHAYPKNETVYADPTIRKTDLRSEEALAGAEFDLYTSLNKTDWTLVESGLTTGEDGTVQPTNSLPTSAYYMFVETKTPTSEYVLDTDFQTVVWIDSERNVCDPDTKVALADSPYIDVTNDKPTIDKFVGTSSNNVEFKNAVINTVGTTVYYKVDVTIPVVTDMSTYETLQVYDTLHEALTINGTPVLKDSTRTYTEGTDYTYSMDSATNKFTIDIVAENMSVDGEYLSLTLTYDCSVNEKLVNSLGQEIINTANLKYSSVVGNNNGNPDPDPDPKPEEPEDITTEETEVHTSGFELKKVNPEVEALAGAKFKLFATREDAKNGTNEMTFMDKNGNKITEAVSGSDGLVSFFGLGYGENGNDVETGETSYWIVETYAPDGYNLLAEPVEVKVSQNSYSYNTTQFNVENHLKTELPMTGGNGNAIFYGIGITAIALGGALYFITKKKKATATK